MSNTVLVIAGYVATGFVGLMGPTLAGRFTRRNTRADRIHAAQIDAASQAMEILQILSARLDYTTYDEWEASYRPTPPPIPATHAIQARLELVLPQCASGFRSAVDLFHDTMAWANENLDVGDSLPDDKRRALESAIRGAADALRDWIQ